MPRAGSPTLPGGAVPPEPMSIGEAATPPFAILPNPATLFLRRAERFRALAPGHQLEPYLNFLASLSQAQNDALKGLPEPSPLDPAAIALAYDNAMPPVSSGQVALDAVFDATLAAFLDRLLASDIAEAPRETATALRAQAADKSRLQAENALFGEMPENGLASQALAAHVLLTAALQMHFARLAARLDAERLQPVADAACPCCGGSPAVSMVVGWPGMHGVRFCVCSMCGTLWHVVRIKCLLCGDDKSIAYHGIDGGPDAIKGETCDSCHGYVKILHQHKDAAVDPVADDVASLGLDMLLRAEGYERGGANPFLIGY